MVKLFVYYHPHMEFRHKILEIIHQVEAECKKYDMPFLLEPIIYSEHPLEPEIRLSLMKEMLEQLKKVQVDIYKLEFPGDVVVYDDEKNIEICREIGKLNSNALDCFKFWCQYGSFYKTTCIVWKILVPVGMLSVEVYGVNIRGQTIKK